MIFLFYAINSIKVWLCIATNVFLAPDEQSGLRQRLEILRRI